MRTTEKTDKAQIWAYKKKSEQPKKRQGTNLGMQEKIGTAENQTFSTTKGTEQTKQHNRKTLKMTLTNDVLKFNI